jgi:AcrR family transcriptional regulator
VSIQALRKASDEIFDTRSKLLNAAEELLIESGFAGMSARATAKSAGVNIAAMRYHFGSKQGLFEAVVKGRIAPVNAQRLRRLTVAEAEHPGSVQAVLDAFLWPVFQAQSDTAARLLMARVMAEPAEIADPVLASLFEEVVTQFTQALHRCLPDYSPSIIAHKLLFVVGAMSFTVLNSIPSHFKVSSNGNPSFQELLAFCVGGFLASLEDAQNLSQRST